MKAHARDTWVSRLPTAEEADDWLRSIKSPSGSSAR
jgi:hypothetical protein